MRDQVANLAKKGIEAVALTEDSTSEDIKGKGLQIHNYNIAFNHKLKCIICNIHHNVVVVSIKFITLYKTIDIWEHST